MRKQHVILAASVALFLVVLGARWWLIGRQGGDVPFLDQWDGEWNGLLSPYVNGTLGFGHLFAAHAEHRIFFSKLVALGLFIVNGQWDARVEMSVNAIFCALLACLVFAVFSKGQTNRFRIFWLATLAVLFAVPYGWENTLAGFQSSFYFLVGFSFIAIWLLLDAPFSWRWWVGAAFLVASLFTMASGLLAAAAMVATLIAGAARARKGFRGVLWQALPTVVLCALTIAIGWHLQVYVEIHQKYRAASAMEFIRALATCLSWPWGGVRPACVVVWAPFLVFMYQYFTERVADGKRERLMLALAAWVVLQAAAVGLSRAKMPGSPRYQDVFVFGLLVNLLAVATIWSTPVPALRRGTVRTLLVLWVVVMAAGLLRLPTRQQVQWRGSISRIETYRTAWFIAESDPQAFTILKDPLEVPYPNAERLAAWLNDPQVQQSMPVGERRALDIQPVRGLQHTSSTSHGALASDESLSSPYPWEPVSVFASSGNQRFEAVVRKRADLPILSFFLSGEADILSVADRQGAVHAVKVTGDASRQQWRRGYAYCPGPVAHISGRGPAPVALAAPKEMGVLSAMNVAVAAAGFWLFIVGIVLGLSVGLKGTRHEIDPRNRFVRTHRL